MIDPSHVEDFQSEGVCVVPRVLDPSTVSLLRAELKEAIEEDLRLRPDVFDRGMVHNCMLRGRKMAELLDHPTFNQYTKHLLADSCILYAYQSSSLPPGEKNYGSRIHVDSPRFIPGFMTNLGVIFPLDDFTAENGATRYLPGSHRVEALPAEDEFARHSRTLEAASGDMVLFNARVAHAAGSNHTQRSRHSLTLNLCRCFMRQRFDFVRMLTKEQTQRMGSDARRLVGWNVRVPTSLEEFYLPESERLYKPGQE